MTCKYETTRRTKNKIQMRWRWGGGGRISEEDIHQASEIEQQEDGDDEVAWSAQM